MADNSNPPPGPVPNTPNTPGKTSGLAITSLVLGILGIFTCGLTALFGLVFGIIALLKVKNSGGTLKGDGIALAGIIVSAIFTLTFPIISAALLLPVLTAAKQRAQTINCVSNERQLALAVRIYESDHTNQFPAAATWCDAITNTIYSVGSGDRVFKCAAATGTSRCDYGFNAALDGMDESKVNPQTVMLFESDGGWNAHGGADSMVTPARHLGGRVWVVAFADGSVQEIRQSQVSTLRWNP